MITAIAVSLQNKAMYPKIKDTPIISVPVPTTFPYLGISSSFTFRLLYECIVLILPLMFVMPSTEINNPKINNIKCAYRLYAVERKIDTKVRNIGQQKCYNDLRKRRRSLAWHEQRASRLKNFALVSARKRAAGRNYSGFGFQTALSARNAAVRNITQFAGGTRSSAVPADTRLPSPQKPLCTARICP